MEDCRGSEENGVDELEEHEDLCDDKEEELEDAFGEEPFPDSGDAGVVELEAKGRSHEEIDEGAEGDESREIALVFFNVG